MNPVLQELLTQLQQRQITFAEFKADLQGLCKMSPSLIAAAIPVLEAAIAKREIPIDEGRDLIKLLDPAQQYVAQTLMRRDAPAMTIAAPNDATVLMNQPAPTSMPDATVAMNRPAATSYDATALINQSQISKQQVDQSNGQLIEPPFEPTQVINKHSVTATERTRLTEAHTMQHPAEGTQQRDAQLPVEKTQRIEPSAKAGAVIAEKTQRIESMTAPATAEKTQRISSVDIDLGFSNNAPEKTQRIAALEPQANADKTQRIAKPSPAIATPGTQSGGSHLGTMERMATDGPLPPTIDMGILPFGPGTVIKERFLLKEQIGSGGMGVVYTAIDRRKTEARDPNPFVAIKILGADFARHPKSLIALQREARKAQELAHPNVVTVFDFDREGDAVYMTMELLQGRSLDGFVREVRGKGVSREVAWPIIKGVAEGLAYAHKKGLVHSDLKPANIFLGEENFPKLLDFGIARAVPARISKQSVKDIFDAGSLGAYTVPYATEEMVGGGEPHPADDVYALGLIAYELLAGVHPYKRQGAPEARKLGMKPAPIKGLPRREWKTIERSISFNRADRPHDAAAFLKALTGISTIQKSLYVATFILAILAGYSRYNAYVAAGPETSFSNLPVATQQQFNAYMSDGDKLWSFYVKDKNILALQEAVEQYAAAYDLHPRNRDAVQALKKAADAALDATKDNPEQQREFAKSLMERSTFLSKDYPPTSRFVQ